MKHNGVVGAAVCAGTLATVVLAGGWSSPARADDTDVNALTMELEGQAPAQTRAPAAMQAAYTRVLDSLIPDLGGDDLQKRALAEFTWERICHHAARPGADAERMAVSLAMTSRLGAATPTEARVWILRMLELVGGSEAVPAIAPLLNDPDSHIAERARRALENNTSPAAAEALRTALGAAATPAWRVALVDAVAYRRDGQAVPALARLLSDNDPQVSSAAADALARIGGIDAARALGKASDAATGSTKATFLNDYVVAADGLLANGQTADAAAAYSRLYSPDEPRPIRIAALHGLVMARGEKAVPLLVDALSSPDVDLRNAAGGFVTQVPGSGATRALANAISRLAPASQVTLIEHLGDRGDAEAAPAIRNAMKSKDDSVRIAAIRALGAVGSERDVLPLARIAAADASPESSAARQSLIRLRNVDSTLVTALPSVPPRVRAEMVHDLAARHYMAAAPVLNRSLKDADPAVRMEAISGLGAVGTAADAPALVNIMATSTSDDERSAASRAFIALSAHAADRAALAGPVLAALPTATPDGRAALLTVLPVTGQGLDAVRAGLKDPNASVADAAVHALSVWPDPAALQDDLALAQADPSSARGILGLRGYVRLAGMGQASEADRLEMFRTALGLARRPEEKTLVLGAMGGLNTPDAVALAAPLLDDPATQDAAALAIIDIAGNINQPPASLRDTLQKARDITTDRRAKQNADKVLRRLK